MNKIIYAVLVITALSMNACQTDFLEERQNKAMLVPAKLADFDALMDNTSIAMNLDPGLGLIGSDDFYAEATGLSPFNSQIQNTYKWYAGGDFFEGAVPLDWIRPYQQVFYANVVLDGLEKLDRAANQQEYDRVKGSALFYRSWAFYQLAQIFAPPYRAATAATDMGVILRLTADINVKNKRSTNLQTHEQIINDLKLAEKLLPEFAVISSRPGKVSAKAFLARIFLSMSDYDNALKYADEALQMQNTLLDYSKISATPTRPMPRSVPSGNAEVIYHSAIMDNYQFPGNGISNTLIRVDSMLYRSYELGDLRKNLFFYPVKGDHATFKGSYVGSASIPLLFSGLATDEMYLIRAEAFARKNQVENAMRDLNTLLIKRWVPDGFSELKADNAQQALLLILRERRKELLARGLRWTDLRRLNQDPLTATSLLRVINGESYTIEAEDRRYVLPIPDNEVDKDVSQNPR